MTEHKKYFETACGDGVLKLSYDAVTALIRAAANEVSGVSEAMTAEELPAEWYGNKGVWLLAGDEPASCLIRLYITVQLGDPITARAAAVQEKIKNALESGTFLKVSEANIYVAGVFFEK